jgi:hypothetical protein
MRQIFSTVGVVVRGIGLGAVALSIIIAVISLNSVDGCQIKNNCDEMIRFTILAILASGVVALVGHLMLDALKGRFFTKIGKET